MLDSLFIESRGQLMSFETPKIMGIINATPDSFYTRELPNTVHDIKTRIEQMVLEGVDILDIGGMSTRPQSEAVSAQEEIDRILPILEWTRNQFPDLFISIDTYRSEVINACLPHQIDIINDISGGTLDSNILNVAAESQLTYVASHIKGTPKDMQIQPSYNDVKLEVTEYFLQFIKKMKDMNINKFILDPGFGFGKEVEHNYQLLNWYKTIQFLGYPLLAGVSRKSMIWKTLKKTPQDSLYGTIAAHSIALLNGAHILRVHDITATKDTINIIKTYQHFNNKF